MAEMGLGAITGLISGGLAAGGTWVFIAGGKKQLGAAIVLGGFLALIGVNGWLLGLFG